MLAEIAALYPSAPIYTLVDFMPGHLHVRLGEHDVRTSFLQRLPGARRHFRALLPLFPSAVERLDLAGYDAVVSTSHAVAKGVKVGPGQFHLCYCFTPMRYAWDLREQYLAQVGLARGAAGWVANRMLDRLAAWDRRASDRVDDFVAISRHIQDRIRRCYGRESSVIYPPVTLPAFDARPRARERYITVSSFVPYKRIDAIAAAFARLPGRELVIVGDGPERDRIRAAAGNNVTLAGQVDDDRRDALLREARAFIFAAEEDFGIAPLEAQALGLPVIGYRRGALAETIRPLDDPHPTGVFFDEQTPQAIAEAVLRFEAEASRIDAIECRRNAERFGAERFRREFVAHFDARLASHRAGERA